jgi:hypothetical protein
MYDGGATAFYHMREGDAFVIPVAFEKLKNSPFYIPDSNYPLMC